MKLWLESSKPPPKNEHKKASSKWQNCRYSLCVSRNSKEETGVFFLTPVCRVASIPFWWPHKEQSYTSKFGAIIPTICATYCVPQWWATLYHHRPEMSWYFCLAAAPTTLAKVHKIFIHTNFFLGGLGGPHKNCSGTACGPRTIGCSPLVYPMITEWVCDSIQHEKGNALFCNFTKILRGRITRFHMWWQDGCRYRFPLQFLCLAFIDKLNAWI